MFGSQVLEVAMGLVFIYLVLSIASSGIKELIAGIFSLRSKTLEHAIHNLLNDSNSDLAARFFAHPLIARTARPGDKPSYVSSRIFVTTLFDLIAPGDGTQPRTLQDLRNGVKTLPNAQLRAAILGFLDSAPGDLEATRKRMEAWYDDTMDRVSGWYKRKAQIIIFVAGLALCTFLNADTFMVVRQLWNDQALRNVVMTEARAEAARANRVADPTLAQVEDAVRLTSSPPIGWRLGSKNVRGLPSDGYAWFEKVMGVLLTASAITMGAPFWFDMLNKIVNLRLSGDPPPTSE